MARLNSSFVLKIVAGLIVLAGLILNGLYWVIWPMNSRAHLVQPDIVGSAVITGASKANTFLMDNLIWVVAVAVGLILLLGLVIWWITRKVSIATKRSRDSQRNKAAEYLQQGFEVYKSSVGHYPLGTLVDKREVPAVGLGYEWEEMGFSSSAEMSKYVAGWPITDPLVSYDLHNQRNQYLYYPNKDGTAYALYMHIEIQQKPEKDFNQLDGLPTMWGKYNFKISQGSADQVSVIAVTAMNVDGSMPKSNNEAIEPTVTPVAGSDTPLTDDQINTLGNAQ